MLAQPRQDFTGKPDAWTTCLSGLEGAGRKRISVMMQRAVLRPYLHDLDNFVKRGLNCPAYLRYVDDLTLFSDDKAELWRWRTAIIDRLAGLRLTLHPATQPRPVTEGIPFLGFVVYPERRRLKRRKGIHFQRRLKRLITLYEAGEIPLETVSASVQGWVNHLRYGNTIGLRKAMLNSSISAPKKGEQHV